MIDWEAFAKMNGLSVEEFKKEIYSAATCAAAIDLEDQEDGTALRFVCSDELGKLEMIVRRVEE